MKKPILSRRALLGMGATGASSLLTGCDALDFLGDRDNEVRNALERANGLTYRVQRLLVGADRLAREYAESDIRQGQRPNGSTRPTTREYMSLMASGFTGYRLAVGGLVEKPGSFSLEELRNMPARTQITRHDCVEGWSTIAKWMGVPLATVLDEVRPTPEARFAVFHCFDNVRSAGGEVLFYGSIDLLDARHPQTILAYDLNGAALPVPNGAPLRLRVERQLGYKMSKFIKSIELVSSFAGIQGGKGGYWEDRGYEWYAGI
ncbi:molybdopterin-binding protein [Chelativorans sp. AA-79]|uniref:molybdopterin-binding protein n=1 Tax=Chelativorans sp. AA-79 TaxID=3028735 RepID=UPI0023F694A1|nr:molybdopterin-binding protein [Chelativorans sp. AA-79]WEX09748.1 molybdopterin-binding protein [Chelativorans sp. AA-79]